MEIISKEHLEDRDDKAESAGAGGSEIYSMGSGGKHTHEAAERDSVLKPEPPGKQKNEVLYWRVGLGLAIILIIAGVIYFIGKGVNWAIHKISGPSQSVATSSIYSNADPLLSNPTEPVVSNQNIVPVGGASTTSSSSGQVMGAQTYAPTNSSANSSSLNIPANQQINPANNCPVYTGSTYYYCDWQSQFIFRGFNSPQEYATAHGGSSAIVPSSPSMPTLPYSSSTLPPPGSGLNQAIAASQVRSPTLANGCPDYTDGEYDYCIWENSYIFRGFKNGQ